jgi:hypothetical protein
VPGQLFAGEAYLVSEASVRNIQLILMESTKGTILSMLLIFVSSLLPDPDTPYSPSRPNLQTWILSIAYELAILVVCFVDTIQPKYESQDALVAACEALCAVRFMILSIMVAIYLVSRRSVDDAKLDSESESLLSPDQGGNYGSTATGTNQSSKDAQSVSAFDYLAGFRDLIPFLW